MCRDQCLRLHFHGAFAKTNRLVAMMALTNDGTRLDRNILGIVCGSVKLSELSYNRIVIILE